MRTNFVTIGLMTGVFLITGCNEKPDSGMSEKSGSTQAIEQPTDNAQPMAESPSEAAPAVGTEMAEPRPVPETTEGSGSMPEPEQLPGTEPAEKPMANEKLEAPAEAEPENP